MKEIFTDFYKRVIGFFQNDKGENTKDAATNRLKLVLLHDRTNLDTVTMQKMREQLINVISKYIEIDKEALDLNLEGEGDSIALMLNIPVVRARTKEEIEELEIAEEEAKRAEILAALEEAASEEDGTASAENEKNEEDASEKSDESGQTDSSEDANPQDKEPENSSESSVNETEVEDSSDTPVEQTEHKKKKSKK